MDYPCPVDGCSYVGDDVDQLAGHIGGMQPRDQAHEDYGEIRRFELLEQSIPDDVLNAR